MPELNFNQQIKPVGNNLTKTAFLSRIAILLALSLVGSYLKFPSPIGSIALDSLAGYLGVIILGPGAGALILALGHLFSALGGGFVLGPFHFLIALLMAFCGFIFSLLLKYNVFLAVVVTAFCNGVAAIAILIPFFGLGFFTALTLSLTAAAIVNLLLAVVISNFLKGKINNA